MADDTKNNNGLLATGLILLVVIAGAAIYFLSSSKEDDNETTTTTTQTQSGLTALSNTPGGLGWLYSIFGKSASKTATDDRPGGAGR